MAALSFQLSMVRHGQTVNNMLQLLQGQKIDAPLNTKGRKQAHELGRRLKDEVFTHVYCSDLKRAVETCHIILQDNYHCSGNANETMQSYTTDSRLQERCMGVLEGQPLAVLRRKAYEYNQHRRVFTPEGGETLRELAHRTESFFRSLCHRLWNDSSITDGNFTSPTHVLVVAHSGSIRSLVGVLGQKYNCDVPHDLIDLPCENTNLTQFHITLRSRDLCESLSNVTSSDDNDNEPYTLDVHCTKLFNSEHLKAMKKQSNSNDGI